MCQYNDKVTIKIMPKKEVSPRKGGGAEEKPRKTQGWGAVAKRSAEMKERQEEAQNAVREFWLKEGESAVVQFLQDEPYCFDAHNVKDKDGNWKKVPCGLNTGKHCTLCSDGVKRTWLAAFMILDYRGSWDKDKKRFKHDKPQVKIWRVGNIIAQSLKQLVDKKGKDLSELVIEVTRSGSGKDTSYNLEQAIDEDTDRRMKPIEWDDDFPTAESLCLPPSEEEIDRKGYSSDDDLPF